ncbi:MAG: 50S ribosomal protein L11 methyltransferase [Bacteroidetes bacterium]|nr:50S ribosomal protein L11 methyltransferase [Bacteroidota bacterium]
MTAASYIDIFIAAENHEELRERLSSVLIEFGFESLMEEDEGIHSYMLQNQWSDNKRLHLLNTLETFHLSQCAIKSETVIPVKNWNEEWERTIQPVAVSEKIIITPSWHPINDPSKIVITIDPKMTFGTGYHETTRLVLRAMEKIIIPGMKVLDVGTGTGVLAIAAVKLGAQSALGIDNDDLCRDNGDENIALNNVAGSVTVKIETLDSIKENNFNLIVANIIRNTILELLPQMLDKLQKDGILILSGLLTSDQEEIENALRQNHCIIQETLQENEWIAVISKKLPL